VFVDCVSDVVGFLIFVLLQIIFVIFLSKLDADGSSTP